MYNALVSNYSNMESIHFPNLELLVTGFCNSICISLFIPYMQTHIIPYSYPLVYFYEILDMHSYVIHIHMWCLGSGYVHSDMHILYRVRVFKLEPCPLYYSLLFVILLSRISCELLLSFLLHQSFVEVTPRISHEQQFTISKIWTLSSNCLEF
jgi:hypothetical protein